MQEFKIYFKEILDRKNLSDIDLNLLNKAEEILQKAYAPYSKFNVGASLLLEDGTYVLGNNQENASFPCGICAERVALFATKANNPHLKIKKIAITTKSEEFNIESPIAPCGMCRQVLLEYEEQQKEPIEVLLFNETKILKFKQAKDLLPLHFSEDRLKRK
jgi:cytidine deaminase